MYLIAEIGINHNGNLERALEMIRVAKECGADCVKFQKRNIDAVYSKEFLDSPRESQWGTTQRDQKEGLEFDRDDYEMIDNYCKGLKIDWTASAWDEESLEMVESFNPRFHKIASPFITHKNFLTKVAGYGRPIVLSTGMANLAMIHAAVNTLEKQDSGAVGNITLMHCVSIYPCPDHLCNVNAIRTLEANFPYCDIGYSGHEVGIEPTLVAIMLGATMIERHFTLDRSSYGSDQAASLEPKGLARIREYGDQIEKCMGDGIIKILPGEEDCARKLRYWE